MSLGKFSKISCPILILVFMSYCSVVIKWHITDQALGARAGALLQARVRGQSRRAVLRQAPDPLRGKPGGISSQRFGALRSGGIFSRKFRASDKAQIHEKVSNGNVRPA